MYISRINSCIYLRPKFFGAFDTNLSVVLEFEETLDFIEVVDTRCLSINKFGVLDLYVLNGDFDNPFCSDCYLLFWELS